MLIFCNIIDIWVKRKTKQIGENKERWLFVIHGNEKSLANLDSLWERVQIQTSWKLETCFKAAASTSHSTLQSFPTPVDSQATAPSLLPLLQVLLYLYPLIKQKILLCPIL